MFTINILQYVTALYKLCIKYNSDISAYFMGCTILHHLANEIDSYGYYQNDNLEKIIVYFVFFIATATESEVVVDIEIIPEIYIDDFNKFKEIYFEKNRFEISYDSLYTQLDYAKLTSKKFMELACMIPTHRDFLYIDPIYVSQEIYKFIDNNNSSALINNCIFELRKNSVKIFFEKYLNYVPIEFLNETIIRSEIFYQKTNKYSLIDFKPLINSNTKIYTRGSTCTVYKLDNYVVKKIKNDSNMNSGLKDIIFSMNLKHPNLGRVYNAFYEQNILYSVLENYGEPIGNINMKKLDISKKKDMFIDIVNGLNYMHSHGIVHRDLSIWNICYNYTTTHIIDFSSSYNYCYNTSNYNIVCISNYRPFDVFMGNILHLPSFDIWSLGCVLYYIHTGIELFKYHHEDDIVIENMVFKLGGPDIVIDRIYTTFSKMEDKYWNLKSGLDLSRFDYLKKILKFDPNTRPSLQSVLNMFPE